MSLNTAKTECLAWLLEHVVPLSPEYGKPLPIVLDVIDILSKYNSFGELLVDDPFLSKDVITECVKYIDPLISEVIPIPRTFPTTPQSAIYLGWKPCFVIAHGFLVLTKASWPTFYASSSTHGALYHLPKSTPIDLSLSPSLTLPSANFSYVSISGIIQPEPIPNSPLLLLNPSISVHSVFRPINPPPISPINSLNEVEPFTLISNIFPNKNPLVCLSFLLSLVSSFFSSESDVKLHISFHHLDLSLASALSSLVLSSNSPNPNTQVVLLTSFNSKLNELIDSGPCIWMCNGDSEFPFIFTNRFQSNYQYDWENVVTIEDFDNANCTLDNFYTSFLSWWIASAASTRSTLSTEAQALVVKSFDCLVSNYSVSEVAIPTVQSIALASCCFASLRGSDVASVSDVQSILVLFNEGLDLENVWE
ncbi:hypothetical protein P9112_002493 [Eukaryota sp. TZLM1-RC]